jgi:hypothetical protein
VIALSKVTNYLEAVEFEEDVEEEKDIGSDVEDNVAMNDDNKKIGWLEEVEAIIKLKSSYLSDISLSIASNASRFVSGQIHTANMVKSYQFVRESIEKLTPLSQMRMYKICSKRSSEK